MTLTTDELYRNEDPDQDLSPVTPLNLMEFCLRLSAKLKGFWHGLTKALNQEALLQLCKKIKIKKKIFLQLLSAVRMILIVFLKIESYG